MWLLIYFVIDLKAKILEVCDAQEEKRPRRKDALVPHQPWGQVSFYSDDNGDHHQVTLLLQFVFVFDIGWLFLVQVRQRDGGVGVGKTAERR